MWGNKTGWMISAVLALLMSSLLAWVALPPTPSAPTNAAVLSIVRGPIALPVSPDTVVPAGTEDCDAAVFYRKAIEDFQNNSDTYDRFKNNVMSVPIKKLIGLDEILKARDCKSFKLFSVHPADVVNYENTEPGLDALDEIGNVCCRVGLLYTNEKYNAHTRPDEARKLWEAAFVLGKRLYDERTDWKEFSIGLGLMSTAARSLDGYYRDLKTDPGTAEAIQKFLDEEGAYQSKLIDAWKIIGGIDENTLGQYAGDIFAMAKKDGAYANVDPMFRTEAVLHVGRYRFNSASTGDQLAARKTLTNMAEETDLPPNVKAAATAAHALTLSDFHKFG